MHVHAFLPTVSVSHPRRRDGPEHRCLASCHDPCGSRILHTPTCCLSLKNKAAEGDMKDSDAYQRAEPNHAGRSLQRVHRHPKLSTIHPKTKNGENREQDRCWAWGERRWEAQKNGNFSKGTILHPVNLLKASGKKTHLDGLDTSVLMSVKSMDCIQEVDVVALCFVDFSFKRGVLQF